RSTSQRNSVSWRTCIRSVTCGCLPSPPKLPSPMRRPTMMPSSRASTRASVSGGSDPLFHRGENRETALPERSDDEMPVGLGALGVRLDVVAVLEVLVHDLALGRAHRVQRDR